MRRKASDVIWMALQYAKQDRTSFIEACSHMRNDPVVKDAERDIEAFNRLQRQLFGTAQSKLDAAATNAKPVTIQHLMRMIENGEIDIDFDETQENQ